MRPRLEARIQCMMTALFILLGAPSVASDVSFTGPLKYLRVLLTILIVLYGFGCGVFTRSGPGVKGLMLFAFVFVVSGLWSTLPAYALFYKGMFLLALLAGLAAGLSMRTVGDLTWGLRFLGMVSGVAAAVVLWVFRANPSASAILHNRIAVLGINPNQLGHTAAPLFVMTVYVALTDRSRPVRMGMIVASVLLTMVTFASGSRGALLSMIAGLMVLLVSVVRRPGTIIAVALLGLTAYFVGFELMKIGGSQRMVEEMTRDTRNRVWATALKFGFYNNPLIGAGWLHVGTQGGYCQSAYVQVLVEAGLVGAMALVAAWISSAVSWWKFRALARSSQVLTGIAFFALATISVQFVAGFIESLLVTGSGVSAICMGLAVGICDNAKYIRSSIASPPDAGASQASALAQRRPSAKEILAAMNGRQRTNLPFPVTGGASVADLPLQPGDKPEFTH